MLVGMQYGLSHTFCWFKSLTHHSSGTGYRQPLNSNVSRMKHIISTSVIILVAASAFFFWLWYEQYLRFEFNELGRYYDAENQIIYTDAGFVWCFPAIGFLLIAFILVIVRILRRMAHSTFKRDA